MSTKESPFPAAPVEAEWRRQSDLTRFYALFPSSALARDIFNIVEGQRIEALIRRQYPGIRRDMDLIQEQTLLRREEMGTSPADLPEVGQVIDALMVSTMDGEPPFDDMPAHVREASEGAIAMLPEVEAEGATVGDTARVTARIYSMIDEVMQAGRRGITEPFSDDAMNQQARKPEQAEGEQETGDVDFNPLDEYEPMEMPPFVPPVMEELVQPESNAMNQIEAEGAEGDAEKDGDTSEEVEAESMEAADNVMQSQQVSEGQMDEDAVAQKAEAEAEIEESGRGSDAEGEETPDSAGGMTPEGAGPEVGQGDEPEEEDLGEQVFMYDEWDHRIEDYRPSWCTLRETRATREVPAFVAAVFHEYGGVVTQIRRNFQLMRPERMRKMRFQAEGDDLDLDGLVEHVVDRRAKITPTDRVYIKRDKKDRDVTTAFLVDMSSSTDRKIDGRKRIIDIEKEGLILMCEALEAIRDEYAIYGFSGNGRDDAQFYTVKEIGERYDDRVRWRIGGIYGRSKTRMGPAIRHATKRLMGVDSSVKLMILLTDGRPYDSDTYQDNAYAQADTQMALREARREKIHLFCVTVDQEGADYLPQMYSDANFVVIDDVRTLPQKLPQLYRRLTT
ncbi:MAG: VWA domain-containing protein [Actinobacteria bacterium]|nr:VWA domain-containing protein [Actinomycetota bacterium]